MKTKYLIIFLSIFFACSTVKEPKPLFPIPTEQQLSWQDLETYAFVHFTINTFTDKEWGYGDEDPRVFHPSDFDPEQWVKVFKEVGMKAVILTAKHHDGFCLWPSGYTKHSVKSSDWMMGDGDVVKGVAEACKKYGLKFGIYLSPWDRNRADYGEPSYLEYYRNQLNELFSQYGPAFEMWFDLANGGDGYYGGANEKRRIEKGYYDWPNTLQMVRRMEPNIVFFSSFGPDVRWCGNEKGFAGETNWSLINPQEIHELESKRTERKRLLNVGDENGQSYMPSEVDVSIRHGWFYHDEENSTVKTSEELFDIYLKSVGRNANLLLNIPPDKRGLIHENDIASLRGWKKILDERFSKNLAKQGSVKVDTYRGRSVKYAGENLIDDNKETYWATDDNILTGEIEIELGNKEDVEFILLQEYIKLGQRVKTFSIEAMIAGNWKKVAHGTTIGHKRIIRLDETVSTRKVRVSIEDSKACPLISNIEVY